ncbi:MAG: hypothetical protein KAQ87_03015 [Candidatus Pacebacteria bacterium]|nr:hypothetical protein [Candidatus Paceibacterota bacterium]
MFGNGNSFRIREADADEDYDDSVYSGTNEYFVVNSGGNVGIGTISSGTLLQLESANAYLTLKNATDENTDGGARIVSKRPVKILANRAEE